MRKKYYPASRPPPRERTISEKGENPQTRNHVSSAVLKATGQTNALKRNKNPALHLFVPLFNPNGGVILHLLSLLQVNSFISLLSLSLSLNLILMIFPSLINLVPLQPHLPICLIVLLTLMLPRLQIWGGVICLVRPSILFPLL